MAFYDLDKEDRKLLVQKIEGDVLHGLNTATLNKITNYFADHDTYIRKAGYLAIGKIYLANKNLLEEIRRILSILYKSDEFRIRQTVVNAAGEIGKTDFESVKTYFEKALFDEHHAVRNAVIGSVKKMGQVNPIPVLSWSEQYLKHTDKEIRREICHGIELRGRTHPEDILPMLQQLEWDETTRVSGTLVHVLGQIGYKKGCLETVIAHLKNWQNKDVVEKALEEIIDVHYRYRDFSYFTQEYVREYIKHNNPL